jgi:histidine kinase
MSRSGFTDLVELHEGTRTVVFRARRSSDNRRVVLKTLRGPRPSPESQERLRREYEFTQLASGQGSVECLDFLSEDEPALVLADRGGQSLDRAVADGPLEIDDVLHIAEQVTKTLARIHGANIIHKDICPGNITWNTESGDVEIIDFGISSRLERHEARSDSIESMLGTLAYMAPEQSGRMNRSVDSRSDLYSFGATLYHLVTGRPPFVATDPLDLLHAHLARVPNPAADVLDGIPASLSGIIDRLLAKSADDRYQSAEGLLADLHLCSRRFAAGDTTPFELGTADGAAQLRVPEKLYGRDLELAELDAAFKRATTGRSELVLVAGWSGIGKTRLVNELQPAMLERRATRVTGKYDQFQRGTPYAAIVSALGRFVKETLSSSDAATRRQREAIVEAAGDQIDLLAELVPETCLLVGEQPAPPPLPPNEAEARVAFLMRRICRTLASAMHPLVIFLDDLQWADLPSMRLLQALVSDPDSRHILLVGAYRDNEIDPGHPLLTLVEDIETQGVPVLSIELGPLSSDDVRNLVADSLGAATDGNIESLADLLHSKTAGNPFFLLRLLESLAATDILRRSPGSRLWTSDLEAVRSAAYTDNVVEFLANSLEELGSATQMALATGALLGERFELRDVADVEGWSLSTTARALDAGLTANMISRVDASLAMETTIADDLDRSIRPTYRFAHDRVQQAARGLLSDQVVAQRRLAIARRLRAAEVSGLELFDLVEHALAGRAEMVPDEQLAFAQLAFGAGAAAAASAAFDPALRYFLEAWNLLGPDPWDVDHELARSIALGGAEAAYLVGDQDRVQSWTTAVIDRCDDLVSKLAAYDIVIEAHNARNELIPAIELAVHALALAGVKLPETPGQADLLAGLVRTKLALRGTDVESIVALPDCVDPVVLATLRIQMRISVSAYYARPDLLPLLAFNMVRTTLRHGVAGESPFGFAIWGLVLCSLGQLDNGLEAGDVAMRLNERTSSPRLRYRATHLYNAHLRIWKDNWGLSRDDLRDNFRACWNGGDLVYAAFGAFMSTTMAIYRGDPLTDVARTATDFASAIRDLQNDTTLQTIQMNRQLALCLIGDAPDPTRLLGEAYDEAAMLAVHEAANDQTNLFLRCMYGAHLALLFGQTRRAIDLLEEGDKHSGGATSTVYSVMHAYLLGVAYAGAASDGTTGSHARRRARKARRQLGKWAPYSPGNVNHRLELIDAELAKAERQDAAALAHYEAAIAGARAGGWQADLALTTELAARFHLGRGHSAIGRNYLLDCRHHYSIWGATAKVAALDEEFPEILGGSQVTMGHETNSYVSTTDVQPDLDAIAMIEAAGAISREVETAGVVETLVRLSVEAAGASRGLLAVAADDDLRVRATANAELSVTSTDAPIGSASVLRRVITYAERTLEDVVVDDAMTDEQYRNDPYVTASGVRSVIAVPIVHQQRLLAMLYLENDLTPKAFRPDRIAILRSLASQAAISLQNAQLYESLEDQVRERTSQLLDARTEAELQRDRADRLLENILPESIATELKRTGKATPVSVQSATVLFTDFKGFTAVAETLSPEDLVAELERVFIAFDRIVDRCGIEKLKTIGDAYMAVGGLPVFTETHATDSVRAALEMIDYVSHGDADHGPPPFEVRVGIHTGPLVAGVIGERRFLYDVWGDTVNIAARLESSGEAGRVNISSATYELVQDQFSCTYRGRVEAKGKGKLDMYFIDPLE